jgi:uncharacterized protein (TIGR00369 family)
MDQYHDVLDIQTHHRIDARLSGEPVEVAPGRACVELTTTPEMAADERGLVHGGFVFSLADYAAMLAVNHPNVVLAAAEVKFLAPAVVGERLVAEARISNDAGKRKQVEVEVRRGQQPIFSGSFHTATPAAHVLEATNPRAPRPR